MNPEQDVAAVLRAMWEDIVGVAVADTDTLLDSGGTSLHALQLAARIQDQWGTDIGVSTLFERQFGGLIDELVRSVGNVPGLGDAITALGSDVAPLSTAQRRMWYAHQLSPETSDYNVGYAFRLTGALDLDLLGRALDSVIARHRILRVVIADGAGGPVQQVLAARPVRLTPEPVSVSAVYAIGRNEVRRPFDMAHGPLWRARLLTSAADSYVLVLTFHHLLVDHQTTQVLLGELSAHYNALLADTAAPEMLTAADYLDYATWEQTQPTPQRRAKALEFWTTTLRAGIRPFDLGPSPGPAGETARVQTEIPTHLAAALHELGARHEASLFAVMLAAWQVLLWRMSGQRAGTVTVPVTGRTRTELEMVAGPLLNPLPMPAHIDPTMRLIDLVRSARDTTWGAIEHDLPVEEIIAALPAEHSDAGAMLDPIKFTVEDGDPYAALRLDGVDVTPLDIADGCGRFDLGLEITRRSGGLAITLAWRQGRYHNSYATGLLYRYLALLSALVAQPEQRVADCDVIYPLERPWLLGLGRGATVTGAELVPQLVAHWTQTTPDNIATADERASITYRDLDQLAGRLAAALRRAGVTRGDRVALLLPPSARYPAAVAGVWRLAASYVPLDPDWPPQRLQLVLADSHATAVVRIGTHRLDGWPGPQIDLDDLPQAAIDAEPLSGHDPAYVIYTSGTTGKPKGVVVQHDALANVTAWHRRRFGVTAHDQVSQVFVPVFDPSILDTWTALTAGARLHVASPEQRHDAVLLCRWLHEQAITVAGVPTGMAEALLGLPYAGELALRIMLVGGDRLHWTATDSVAYEVVNVYGPTEATIWATSATVAVRGDHRPPPIGQPMDNVRAYLRDEQLRPVPVGVVGELYLAGAGVALGYLGQPGLTAQRFLPDPDGKPGDRMYRTGDLARWLPDGAIEFLGRVDDQVKVRGHRIELAEVETALREHPTVKQAVAAVREQRLIGYIVAAEDISELATHMRERLPSYLIPDAVLPIKEIPLTPNGKIDRRALPDAPLSHTASIAPRTQLERDLCGIWTSLMPGNSIGIDDNFFELGGHSLLAIRATVAIRNQLGRDLSVSELLARPTVAELARHLETTPAPTPLTHQTVM